VLIAGPVFGSEPAVRLTKTDDTVQVTIDGREFTVFRFSQRLPKPFFAPVRAADGTILTRPVSGLDADPQLKLDHVHHKGIWLAVDEVNGIKFWAEKGKIENQSVTVATASGNPAQLTVVNRWISPEGQPVLTETSGIQIFANRLIAYDIAFRPAEGPVSFHDTKEGLFGFRMADSMRETEGGQVVNADGLLGTAECWGKPSAWVDYFGTVNGKTFGVALMDHPQNFRRSRYHVRNYGLFSMSPFGEKAYTGGKESGAPVVVKPNETLRLRYGLYIHQGDTKTGDVAGAFAQFVKATE
jgi:hypothetical protein